MLDNADELHNNTDLVRNANKVEDKGNVQQVEDFSEVENTIPEYKGNNKKLINNFLHDNPDLQKILYDFLKNEERTAKKAVCKSKLMKCETYEDIKAIVAELTPGGYKVGEQDTLLQNIIKQSEEDKAQAEEDKAQAEENKAKLENSEAGEERVKIIHEAMDKRNELIAKYGGDLDSKTNEFSENYNKVKSDLESNGVLSQLKQLNPDEQFINDYIKVQATLLELKSNPTVYEQEDISIFDKIVKNLNNSCNIPDTKLSSFDIKNISQTRKELFNKDIGNDSLIKAKESNLESRKYPEGFFDMGDEEVVNKYGRFLEGSNKDFWLKYQNDIDFRNKTDEARNNPNPSNQEMQMQVMYDNMLVELKNKKEEMDKGTKNLVEELCLVSQIKGMYMCMGEGEKFDLNKANEIQSDNGVLTLNGHIDGVNFAIRQDTKNPEARLQTSLKLAKSVDGNTFTVGGENSFADSNFILPSQAEIFNVITGSLKEDVSLENSDTKEDYFEKLQTTIMGRIDNQYEDTKYTHKYMENQVKGEKVVDTSLALLRKVQPKIDMELSKPINQTNNAELYGFIKTLNFNIENSTVYEKEKLNACISKIGEISETYKANIEKDGGVKYSPIIENYLKNQVWLSDGNEDIKLRLIFQLFSKYNEYSITDRVEDNPNQHQSKEGNDGVPSKFIIDNLYKDIFEYNNGNNQSQAAMTRQDEEDKKDADAMIESLPEDNS